jgi:hypothetical protein
LQQWLPPWFGPFASHLPTSFVVLCPMPRFLTVIAKKFFLFFLLVSFWSIYRLLVVGLDVHVTKADPPSVEPSFSFFFNCSWKKFIVTNSMLRSMLACDFSVITKLL